jgi:predicted HTH domain antitoxin
MKLFETGKLSSGHAAKFSGYLKRAFMEILGKYGIPVFDYHNKDLAREMNI